MAKALNGSRKKSAVRLLREQIEADLIGESALTPLLPTNLINPVQYRSLWKVHGQPKLFEKTRALLTPSSGQPSDFFGWVHKLKKSFFHDGFRFTGDAGKQKEWKRFDEVFGAARRLASDVWHEWLAMDNAVAYWVVADGNNGSDGSDGRPVTGATPARTLPPIVVLDCETLRYTNTLGVETLKVKLRQTKLSPEQKAKLTKRWIDAYEKGEEIELKESEGDRYKVLTRAKLGAGLADPALGLVLDKLGTLDLLRLADWCGAWQHRNVIEHVRAGHEIKSGERAGDPKHFLNEPKRKLIDSQLKRKAGAFRAITNFDVSITYDFLNPSFFDAKKYEGVMGQLKAWAGAVAMLYEHGTPSPTLMLAFGAEGRADRADVGAFIESILNDPDYIGEKPPVRLTVGWNPNSFRDTKMMLEWLRLAGGQGWLSPQTAREAMDLDDDTEGDRLEEAAKKPARYRPPFEPKQGMLTNDRGGRPPERETPRTEG